MMSFEAEQKLIKRALLWLEKNEWRLKMYKWYKIYLVSAFGNHDKTMGIKTMGIVHHDRILTGRAEYDEDAESDGVSSAVTGSKGGKPNVA